MKKTCFLSVLLSFVLVMVSQTAGSTPESDFIPQFLDREEAVAAAKAVTSEVYPDADAVMVDDAQWIRYHPDGTYVKWDEKYIRILTEKGRRKFLTISSYFTIPYQRGPEDCKITLLEIIKPDGTVVPVDVGGQSKIMVNPSSMKSNIYNPNNKIIKVNVAGLEEGDILHYVMYDRIVHPRVPDAWFDWLTFESSMPILRRALSVYAPNDLPLKSIALKGEIAGTVNRKDVEKDGLIIYQWEARHIPQLFSEPNMPPPQTVSQRLLLSTFPDWESVSRWYWNLSSPHLETTPAIENKIAQLTDGIEDPQEKIEALFRFVSQQIRYLGTISETEAPGYEPHDVKDTFDARHGVCRDKAALLAAMLRAAGFDAYPALIYVGPRKDPEVPQPSFNHAITALRQEDGTFLLMDSTDETTAKLLPSYLDDKSYLVATPGGERLRTSPIDPAGNNLMRINTVGSIDRSGRLDAETVFHFEGINDNAYRRAFAGKKPEERRRFFEALMKTAGASTRVNEVVIEPEDLMDTGQPLTALVKYRTENVLVRGENATLLSLPSMGLKVGVVNFIIGQTGLEKRRFPLRTEVACGIRERIQLALDPSIGETVFMPEGEPIDDKSLSWKLASRRSGSELEYETEFLLKTVEFSPAEYLRLKKTLKQIERELRGMPIFSGPESSGEEKAHPADILMLDDEISFNLTDRHNWTKTRSVRKKILTYSGKKQAGELKFIFNPVWEEITLDQAKVTNPDGSVREVGKSDINLMDAPWVGSAPRYPGGKILVVSLPQLEIGSIIEYSYTDTFRDRPFFADYAPFRSYDILKTMTVTLEVPADLPLTVFPDKIETVTMEQSVAEEDDTRVVYYWTAKDIPPLQREEELPPWWSFLPTVFTSAGDWKTYAGEVNAVLTAAASFQPKCESQARSLVEGEVDPWKRLEIIRDFIAVNVRKSGPGINELPLSAVTGADRTLREGYGNTTDRGVLYYAMLKAVGFDPEFVLASPRPMIDRLADIYRKVPNPGSFPVLLVRLDNDSLGLEEGSGVYLNDTDQYAALGATPHEGKMSIAVPGGRLDEIRPALATFTRNRIEMGVNENGAAVFQVEKLLWGNEYGKQKKFFAELTPEKKRRYYQELVGVFSRSAEAVGELTSDFSGYPGRIEFALNIPDYAVPAGEYLYFFQAAAPPVFKLSSDDRISPLYLKKREHTDSEINIELPPGFAVDYLPQAIQRTDAAGVALNIDFKFQAEPGRITIRGSQSLDPSIVQPSRYRELLDLYRVMIDRKFKLFLLRRPPEEPIITTEPIAAADCLNLS